MIFRGEIERGDDDDRDVPPRGIRLQCRDDPEPVHLGHHQIEQQDIRQSLLESIQSQPPVGGLAHHPAARTEQVAHEPALLLVILDDKNRARLGRAPIARQDLDEPVAIDRLSHVSRSAERNAAALLVDDRDDDHRDVGERRIALQCGEDGPAVDVGHHDVEGDRRGPQRARLF